MAPRPALLAQHCKARGPPGSPLGSLLWCVFFFHLGNWGLAGTRTARDSMAPVGILLQCKTHAHTVLVVLKRNGYTTRFSGVEHKVLITVSHASKWMVTRIRISVYIYISRLLCKKSLAVVGGAFNLPLFHWQEPFPSQIEFWKQFVFFFGWQCHGCYKSWLWHFEGQTLNTQAYY